MEKWKWSQFSEGKKSSRDSTTVEFGVRKGSYNVYNASVRPLVY